MRARRVPLLTPCKVEVAMRFVTGFTMLALLPTLAWAGECEDDFSECQELCSVQYGGSIRDEMKAKFVKCLNKCRGKAQTCRERTTETKSNHLNDGALDRSPSSRDVDEFGMPILKKAPPPEKPSTREELRDEDSAPPPVKVTKPAKKTEPLPEPVAKPKPKSLDDDDLSKSDRAPVVTEKPAPREPTPEPAPVVKKKSPPAEPVVKPAEPPAKKVDDDDLRNY